MTEPGKTQSDLEQIHPQTPNAPEQSAKLEAPSRTRSEDGNWHAREPQLTPLDVQHREFGAAWRGWRKDEVRAYLLDVAQSLEAGLRERAGLMARVQSLGRQVQDYRESEDELRRTLVAAERISSELRDQAKQEAALTVQEAENRAALLSKETANREQATSAKHESRLRELESAFSLRRAQLEALSQAQEHDLETRSRDRLAILESEFSARYAELSGRLSSAHAEYAQFMSQYRAVSQAFAQAANTHLPLENPSLPHRLSESLSTVSKVQSAPSERATETPEAAAVQIEEQRFS